MCKYKTLLFLIWLSHFTLAEPPLNSYLSPERQSTSSQQSNQNFGGRHPDSDQKPGTSYLPPVRGSAFGETSSSTYGPPSFGSGGQNRRQISTYHTLEGNEPNQNGVQVGKPKATYELPKQSSGDQGARPSSIYGTPSLNVDDEKKRATISTYGVPEPRENTFDSSGQGRKLSSTYGAPNQNKGGGGAENRFAGAEQGGNPTSTYRPPRQGDNDQGERPTSVYGLQSQRPGERRNEFDSGGQERRPNFPHRVPSRNEVEIGGASSSSYEPTQNGKLHNLPGQYNLPQNQVEHDGSGGYGGEEEKNFEPAKYEFQYEVNDPQIATQFYHKEFRDGDRTIGEYKVLLPDGRKQIVQYEVDSNGYKPKISYEGGGFTTGLSEGSLPGPTGTGASAESGGYPSGAPEEEPSRSSSTTRGYTSKDSDGNTNYPSGGGSGPY